MNKQELFALIKEKGYYGKRIVDKNIKKIALKSNVIFTIAFNNSEVIREQISAIMEHCRDEYSYLVFDNSSNLAISNEIANVCNKCSNVIYVRLPIWNGRALEPSVSHGIALNFVFKKVLKMHREIDNVLILDHDIFPMKDFRVSEIGRGQDVYGWKREDNGIWYVWPGYMYLNMNKIVCFRLDFKPGYGGDTGSSNWKVLYKKKSVGELKFAKWEKKIIKVDGAMIVTRSSSEVDIFDDTWLHMVNASDWAGVGLMDKKLQKVREILSEER